MYIAPLVYHINFKYKDISLTQIYDQNKLFYVVATFFGLQKTIIRPIAKVIITTFVLYSSPKGLWRHLASQSPTECGQGVVPAINRPGCEGHFSPHLVSRLRTGSFIPLALICFHVAHRDNFVYP